MKLSNAAKVMNGQLLGTDAEFQKVATDTRKLNSQELFFALKGPNFDGHKFIQSAAEQGAVAAVVDNIIPSSLPLIKVTDTLLALGQLAAYHRQQFSLPIIGITGSCGKTTTKTMLNSILQKCGPTVAPEGTFNNAIGVPITLLQLTQQHKYAIIEMGTNSIGEIHYIAQMTKPTVSLITNADAAHLAAFGDTAGVAREKGEIYTALTANGTAIINSDDQFASYWRSLLKNQKIIYFGINHAADITAKNIELNDSGRAHFLLVTPIGEIAIQLPELGKHNVMNALAAASAALTVHVPLEIIKLGLENTPIVNKRLAERISYNGIRLIDDSYNGTPPSFDAALAVLSLQQGEKILVMGDVLELGDNAKKFHSELGQKIKQHGIKYLYAFGDQSRFTVEAFGKNGRHYQNMSELIAVLRKDLDKSMVVLIKGSRGMRMERVVEGLMQSESV